MPAASTTTEVAQMVQLTGGVEADLGNTGTPNWTDELNALWPQLATQLLEYPLSGTPVTTPMTITVTDNGVPIPQLQNGFPQWTYDPKNNAVQFDPLAFPQPGDMVQVNLHNRLQQLAPAAPHAQADTTPVALKRPRGFFFVECGISSGGDGIYGAMAATGVWTPQIYFSILSNYL